MARQDTSEPRPRIVDGLGRTRTLLSALRDDDVQVALLCLLVLVGSLVLCNTDDGRTTAPLLGKRPLPPVCPSRVIFGVRCPGCGMVRSFVAMGHLRFREAWQHNRVGPALYVLVLLQIPYRLRRFRRRGGEGRGMSLLCRLAAYVVFVALILNWTYNLIAGRVVG